MAPKYKLIYFDIKGLGECIKYILEYKEIDYDCETIYYFTKKTPWEEIKSSMPFGQLPVLEVNGERLNQSISICQYLGSEHGLAAENSWEEAQLSAIAATVQDMIKRIALYYYDKTTHSRIIAKNECITKVIPYYLQRFEDILQAKGEYFAGSKLTWADFYFVAGLEASSGMMEDESMTNGYPAIENLQKRIWSLPTIERYIKQRPPYPR